MLIGKTEHSIDAKGRYILPAKFRMDMGKDLVLAKGKDKCLYVYPVAQWQETVAELRNSTDSSEASRRHLRNFFSSAFDVTVDSQFRIVIPPELRKYACLDKDIVTVGMYSRLEIWDKQRWMEYFDESEEDYDDFSNDDEGAFF